MTTDTQERIEMLNNARIVLAGFHASGRINDAMLARGNANLDSDLAALSADSVRSFATLGEAMKAERSNETDRRNGRVDPAEYLTRRNAIRSAMVAFLPTATMLSSFVGAVS